MLDADQTRTGTYGSWYNYYLCGFDGQITLPSTWDIPGSSSCSTPIQAKLNNTRPFHSNGQAV